MVHFNDRIVARFLQATLVWGLIALFAGFYAALQMLHWQVNTNLAFLSFGRLRPLHTDLMLLAFGANAFFAGSLYALQRLSGVRLWSDRLALVHFWGWQGTLLIAAVTLALGYTQGRPYTEMEWPVDILLAVAWMLFMVNFFVTLHRRQTAWLSISIWFFIAALIGSCLLLLSNALIVPVSFWKSYSLYAGLTDAFVQNWFAANAWSFFVTIPFLGLMYYFVPKLSQRPIYSYRLAVLQFWSLMFLLTWKGTQALVYTSLPEWLQSLGVVAGLMLLAPHWGGVVNGLLTLGRDAQRFRKEPVLLFLGLALLSYGLVACTETLTSFKSLHLLLQPTDWRIAETHLAAMGWMGSMIFALAYGLIPRLWGRSVSRTLMRWHFGLHGAGLLVFVLALAIGGLWQALKMSSMQEDGLLSSPQFAMTLLALKPFYKARMIGGTLFLMGALVAVFNLVQAARAGTLTEEAIPARNEARVEPQDIWEQLEQKTSRLALAILGALLIGTLIEFIPLFSVPVLVPEGIVSKPYSPLEWYGHEIYLREGCTSCHTQQVRWSLKEELRYGPVSQAWESMYEHPALWGQRRNGPDLQRVGNKYPDSWLYQHLLDPRLAIPESTMPAYPWLALKKVDIASLPARSMALQHFGINAGVDPEGSYREQAKRIQTGLGNAGIKVEEDVELLALIGYLQRIGNPGKP